MATSDEVKEWMKRKKAGVLRMQSRQKLVHSKMAKMIESNPSLIENAKQRVQDRLTQTGEATREIYLEWQRILSSWSMEQITGLLRSDDDQYDQIKACAPFDFQSISS